MYVFRPLGLQLTMKRMQWRNTAEKYGIIGQALHWLVVLGIIAAYFVAEAAEDNEGLRALHGSIGISILALAVLRVLWRVLDRSPPWPATMAGYERMIARITHLALYVLLFTLSLTGWLLSSAEGDAVRFFGVFELPPLHSAAGEEILEEVHEVLFNILLAFSVLHIVGALKHHFWNRDHVLRSMLPGRVSPTGQR
jgi:cytochrome b561